MIVRNEEARLEACLRSVAGVADELVVVDTGSTDRTMEIARELGAVVHERRWRSDFALHRNESIALATGEWVLVIDGDEELTEPADLRAVIEGQTGDAAGDFITVQIDAIGDGGLAERHAAVRVIRRRVARYEHPVHNQLVGVAEPVPSRAVITSHYEGRLHAKAERSMRILLQMVARDPRSAHACYFLCKTRWALGDLEGCLEWGQRAQTLVDDRPGYADLWVWLFYATLALEGPDAAEACLADGVARHPCFPELRHCQMALAALRWNEAVSRQGLYALTSQASLRYLPGLPRAAELLGLPLLFGNTGAGEKPINGQPPHA